MRVFFLHLPRRSRELFYCFIFLSCLFWVLKWHERHDSFDYFVSYQLHQGSILSCLGIKASHIWQWSWRQHKTKRAKTKSWKAFCYIICFTYTTFHFFTCIYDQSVSLSQQRLPKFDASLVHMSSLSCSNTNSCRRRQHQRLKRHQVMLQHC